jgi:hypothetical protein
MIGDQILENFVSTVAEEHDQTIVLYGLANLRAGRQTTQTDRLPHQAASLVNG